MISMLNKNAFIKTLKLFLAIIFTYLIANYFYIQKENVKKQTQQMEKSISELSRELTKLTSALHSQQAQLNSWVMLSSNTASQEKSEPASINTVILEEQPLSITASEEENTPQRLMPNQDEINGEVSMNYWLEDVDSQWAEPQEASLVHTLSNSTHFSELNYDELHCRSESCRIVFEADKDWLPHTELVIAGELGRTMPHLRWQKEDNKRVLILSESNVLWQEYE